MIRYKCPGCGVLLESPSSMAGQQDRCPMCGCGMAVIPLGDGVIDIAGIVTALKDVGFDGATTLEVAGPDNVKVSAERLVA